MDSVVTGGIKGSGGYYEQSPWLEAKVRVKPRIKYLGPAKFIFTDYESDCGFHIKTMTVIRDRPDKAKCEVRVLTDSIGRRWEIMRLEMPLSLTQAQSEIIAERAVEEWITNQVEMWIPYPVDDVRFIFDGV